MAGPSLMDSLFQSSLDDVIKGLRQCPPGTEATFIGKAVDEIRREIKSTDPQTKATALQKLTYLHSLHGVDMSWAAFHTVELSSATTHLHKRIACCSASLSFNPSTTDVILLLTHQLRKDLSSSNVHDVSLALSTLSSICNTDLSRDLTPELFTLIGSSRLVVRKKAIAVILRVFEQYPDAVRVCFKRIVENLESSDMGVLAAVVGLFCELTVKEPRSYLPLAPEFYKILVDCKNNWILIKVLKIFAKLAPVEPRLGRRLVDPICEHMERSGAKSLTFECVRTILTSLSEYEYALKLAVEKVREFLQDDDPNLKYLALQALVIASQKHMWVIMENKELVIKALSDGDANIKLEALRLVMAMVCEDNVMDICRILISHARKSDPEFCDEILGFILLTCSRNFYEIVFDFDWYVSFLGEIARLPHCQKGREICRQMVDIGIRVNDARRELVHISRHLVIDPALLGNPFIYEVLGAAAWISGEYVGLSKDPFELMEALLQPRTNLLPPTVRSIYMQSAFKVLAFCIYSYVELNGDEIANPSKSTVAVPKKNLQERFIPVAGEPLSATELDNDDMNINDRQTQSFSSMKPNLTKESMLGLVNLVETKLRPLAGSDEVEIHERASNVLGLVKLMKPILHGCPVEKQEDAIMEEQYASEMIKLVVDLFSEELGPVSHNAQERVRVPDGLVLKENLRDLDAICDDSVFPLPTSFSLVQRQTMEKYVTSIPEGQSKEDPISVSESTSLLAKHRKRHGLYYLPSDDKEMVSNDSIPVLEPKDEGEDLVMLTKQSLALKKKANKVKARPVVVKLDDGENLEFTSEKHEIRADLLSGAVEEVLLGNEATTSSMRSKLSNKSNSGRGERNTHGEDKRPSTGGKETEETDQKGRKKKKSSRQRKLKLKPEERADVASSVAVEWPKVPDFLL